MYRASRLNQRLGRDHKKMFVSQWHLQRSPKGIIYPPQNHRRTAQQIRDWFELGNGGKKVLIENAEGVEYDINCMWYDAEV